MLDKEAIIEELLRGSIFIYEKLDNEGNCVPESSLVEYLKTIDLEELEKIRENSIEVTLGDSVKVYDTPCLDVLKDSPTKTIYIPLSGLVLEPHELYLGRTFEYTKTYGFVPMLAGTSLLASMGMEIHVTAGFGDNGFEGTWTLEIVCTEPIRVYPNMKIGELYYIPLYGDADIQYHGKYLGQVDPTASRLSREYSKDKVLVMNRVNK